MSSSRSLLSFPGERASIRRAHWSELPLGSVIVDWPTLHNASIPELAQYPVITQRLRAELANRYQFLSDT